MGQTAQVIDAGHLLLFFSPLLAQSTFSSTSVKSIVIDVGLSLVVLMGTPVVLRQVLHMASDPSFGVELHSATRLKENIASNRASRSRSTYLSGP